MHPSRNPTRRNLLAGTAGLLSVAALRPVLAQSKTLHFGVGPLLPNPEDTKKVYTPVFAHLAEQMGVGFDLVTTTDWAGMAVAMASGHLDVAWMGPWGYVIANNRTNCQAVATVKYDEKPVYYGIIIGRPDLKVAKFPDDTRGLSMSFADLGSTTGWLMPTYYAKELWKIDPKAYWKYSEGATHAANEVAVSNGQVDMATDFDRNRNAMIAGGQVKAEQNKIIWQSPALPNDAIVLPADAPRERSTQVQQVLTAISAEMAKSLLPPHYTGFVVNTHEGYASIEKAGIAVGRIKPRSA